jgi:hypothetical protein
LKLNLHHLGASAGHSCREHRPQPVPRPYAKAGLDLLYRELAGLGSDQGSGDKARVAVVSGPAEPLADVILAFHLDPPA